MIHQESTNSPGSSDFKIQAAVEFMTQESKAIITPFGSGHINDTFLVTPNDATPPFILQRINHHVFTDVAALMKNISIATHHLEKKSPLFGYQTIKFITTADGRLYTGDHKMGFWRAMKLIEGTETHNKPANNQMASEAGKALGAFHAMFADFDANSLTTTLPHFHHVGRRLSALRTALKNAQQERVDSTVELIKWIDEHQQQLQIIDRVIEEGKLPVRVVHNDPKINNILFNKAGEALCMIDLDTVMPGSLLHDFGDAIRTSASLAVEDEPDTNLCGISLELFEHYLSGYLKETNQMLTTNEIKLLPESALILTFTIGLRFLTDYLAGDVYYKTSYPEHNLVRAKAQFSQARDILHKIDIMHIIVASLCT